MLCCSLGVQIAQRYRPDLSNWTLTFWRSLLQLVISPLFLLSTNQKLFGRPGSRLKISLVVSSIFCFSFVVAMGATNKVRRKKVLN